MIHHSAVVLVTRRAREVTLESAPDGRIVYCDFDNDGDVDVDDFQIMKDNWGYDGTGGGAPLQLETETPEPATMTVLAIGGLLILRRKRRTANVNG